MRTERQAAPLARGGGTVSGGGKPADRGQSTTPARRPQGPAHGRMVGDCWQKTVCASKHMLRAPKAWAVDVADLDAAERCETCDAYVLPNKADPLPYCYRFEVAVSPEDGCQGWQCRTMTSQLDKDSLVEMRDLQPA